MYYSYIPRDAIGQRLSIICGFLGCDLGPFRLGARRVEAPAQEEATGAFFITASIVFTISKYYVI
jgi:hypothetical protein